MLQTDYPCSNQISPSNRSRNYIEHLAERVAKKLHCRAGADLESEVVPRLGGRVLRQQLSGEEPEGSVRVDGEGDFTIYLSPYIGRLRNRFTIAHELGHYFLHSLMGEKPIHVTEEGGGLTEREADWFAIGLLMPEKIFRKQARKLQTTEALAAHFDVSPHLVKIRKESLGL